ncbi:MAG: hypothetical protein E7449_01515 [Ruminococcaceae bacterium]|nr:hypothetical protein [Oscillospiraceae bacterium]
MDDLESKINQVLSDPQSMQKIFSIAQSLGVSPPTDAPKEETPAVDSSLLPDLSMLSTLGQLMQSQGASDSRHTELLNALRPFLRPERQQSLDRALRVAKLSHLARFALNNLSESQ